MDDDLAPYPRHPAARQDLFEYVKRVGDMPIYEFYCAKCNTIYNFFSRTANTDKIPTCP